MLIRTINAVYEEIKRDDPDTCITLSAIRRAVTSGDIRSRRIGRGRGWKYMTTKEAVLKYFSGEEIE